MSARTAGDRAMTEQQLLANVLDLCTLLRLHVMHINPAQLGGRWMTAVNPGGIGYPDLTITGPGGVLFRELKTECGRLSPEQDAWIDALVRANANVRVWRPRDWHSNDIARQLQALTGRRKAVA